MNVSWMLGKIGPDYILGHAHNDIFSFILYVDNEPFIIDRGISAPLQPISAQIGRKINIFT